MQSLTNIIRVGTSRRMRGDGLLACEWNNEYTLVVGQLKETAHLEDKHVCER